MAAGAFTMTAGALEKIGDGTLDMDTHTFNWFLTTSAWSVATALYVTTNELATANGYTQGGVAATGVTWTETAGVVTFDTADLTPAWTASGGSIGPFRNVVLYSDTATNKDIVGYFLADATPGDETCTDGNTITITSPATGWITIGP